MIYCRISWVKHFGRGDVCVFGKPFIFSWYWMKTWNLVDFIEVIVLLDISHGITKADLFFFFFLFFSLPLVFSIFFLLPRWLCADVHLFFWIILANWMLLYYLFIWHLELEHHMIFMKIFSELRMGFQIFGLMLWCSYDFK